MRLFWSLVGVVVLIALAGIGGLVFIDSDAGRQFVVRQLPLFAPKSGLTVRAGRIDGSIFGRATIHDLEFGDPQGVFARAAEVTLDWRPFDLTRNRLSIRDLASAELRLLRRPALRPSADKRILPDIDIAVGRLNLPRIVLEAPVIGTARVASLGGNADIRSGRARLVLDAAAVDGGDRLTVRLDAEPDRDRFDLDASVVGPRGGIVAGLVRLDAPVAVDVAGDGRWSQWRGTARATLGATPIADLRLSADAGQFGVHGRLIPGGLLRGMAARLAAPGVDLDATAFVEGRTARVKLHATTPALAVDGAGELDFGDESFSDVAFDARLLRPAIAHPRLAGRDIRLHARLAGTFAAPLVDYVATAPQMAWGPTGFDNVRAVGIVQAGVRPVVIPVTATATRLTGVGILGAQLLANVRVTGPFVRRGNSLVATDLVLRTQRLSGRGGVTLDLGTGDFTATGTGSVPAYLIPGLGLADLNATLRAVGVPGGARVTGTAGARLTRVDNAFFRTLLEGLPVIAAPITVDPAGNVAFAAARLTAPGLSLSATGTRSVAGLVQLAGSGVSRRYGPLDLRLVGPIERPLVDVTLARPGQGIGLKNVVAHVSPEGPDWRVIATGASDFGALDTNLLARTGSVATLDIASLALAGVTARGTIVQAPSGPFAGQLALAGTGVGGSVALSAAGAVQRADVTLDATAARLPMPTPITIARARVNATMLLDDAGPSITGRFEASGIRRLDTVLTSASGNVDYRDGHGSAKLTAAGLADSPFSVASAVVFAGDRIEVTGNGVFDRRRIGLERPAVLTRQGGDWLLAPTIFTTPDGRAEISGRFGETRIVKARLDNLGLSLLNVINPDLDFAGRISGTLDLTLPPGELPTGAAALRVTGLSRAGLAASSLPIDVAVNAALDPSGGSARAVIVRGGAVEGRVQAQLRSIPGGRGDATLERLLAAPLFAQARFAGPAGALWPLAGIEALDVRGPVRVAADIGGSVGSPTLAGTITSDGMRVENVTLGTVVERLSLDSRFNASRLELTRFSGSIGTAGTVTGSGSIGLSADESFPMDIRLALKDADALKRDDLSATVTGDIRLVSGRDRARITGKLVADRARFRVGRPASAEVATLNVREVNAEAVRRRVATVAKPTRWDMDIAVTAPGRVTVEGMGLRSEWRGDLQVRGTPTEPALTGRVRLVRGDYDFAGKRFELTRGDLRFTGPYPPDPIVDVAAENTSASFTATLTITGTGLRPEIAFGSVPALPQDEVLSRVLFGTSIASLSAPEALQLAGALASLRGGKGEGLNPINLVRKGLGIDRLRILPADTTTGRRTSIAAGQYIGRRVYLELASDAQGYTATNIEVSLTRSLSVLSQVATLGGTSVNLRLKKDY